MTKIGHVGANYKDNKTDQLVSTKTFGMSLRHETFDLFRKYKLNVIIIEASPSLPYNYFAEHQSGRLRSFRENAHNSLIAWYILIKICLLVHFNFV